MLEFFYQEPFPLGEEQTAYRLLPDSQGYVEEVAFGDEKMLKIAPEEIGDDTPLFTPEGLGLDSIDALELAVGLEKNFGVRTPSAEVARSAFLNVNSIAEFIRQSGSDERQS